MPRLSLENNARAAAHSSTADRSFPHRETQCSESRPTLARTASSRLREASRRTWLPSAGKVVLKEDPSFCWESVPSASADGSSAQIKIDRLTRLLTQVVLTYSLKYGFKSNRFVLSTKGFQRSPTLAIRLRTLSRRKSSIRTPFSISFQVT